MAEFTLPANSKVKIGNTHEGPDDAGDIRAFKVYRYDPDSNETPRLDTYEIDLEDCGRMVLDALIKIKDQVDTSFCLLYTSPSPRDQRGSRMPSSA